MKTHKPSKPESVSAEPAKQVRSSTLLTELAAQEKLMKAAQRFAVAFDQNRRWSDDMDRLTYTLQAWKELAIAAVEFSEWGSANHVA